MAETAEGCVRPSKERLEEIRRRLGTNGDPWIASLPHGLPTAINGLLAEIDALSAALREREATLEKIAATMRLREAHDFLLSEIQDWLTIGGYDVPLRTYKAEAALSPKEGE